MNIHQGNFINKNSICLLILDRNDIKSHLKCNNKTVNLIMGLANEGKITNILMDSFWESIDIANDLVNNLTEKQKKHYEKLGDGF